MTQQFPEAVRPAYISKYLINDRPRYHEYKPAVYASELINNVIQHAFKNYNKPTRSIWACVKSNEER